MSTYGLSKYENTSCHMSRSHRPKDSRGLAIDGLRLHVLTDPTPSAHTSENSAGPNGHWLNFIPSSTRRRRLSTYKYARSKWASGRSHQLLPRLFLRAASRFAPSSLLPIGPRHGTAHLTPVSTWYCVSANTARI